MAGGQCVVRADAVNAHTSAILQFRPDGTAALNRVDVTVRVTALCPLASDSKSRGETPLAQSKLSFEPILRQAPLALFHTRISKFPLDFLPKDAAYSNRPLLENPALI